MSTEGEWIKMSERVPQMADLPLWAIGANEQKPYLFDHGTLPGRGFAHWQPATLPAPPKPDASQYDADQRAFFNWQTNPASQMAINRYDAWHAALAWERAQNAKDIQALDHFPAGFDIVPHVEALARLRKRAGLT